MRLNTQKAINKRLLYEKNNIDILIAKLMKIKNHKLVLSAINKQNHNKFYRYYKDVKRVL